MIFFIHNDIFVILFSSYYDLKIVFTVTLLIHKYNTVRYSMITENKKFNTVLNFGWNFIKGGVPTTHEYIINKLLQLIPLGPRNTSYAQFLGPPARPLLLYQRVVQYFTIVARVLVLPAGFLWSASETSHIIRATFFFLSLRDVATLLISPELYYTVRESNGCHRAFDMHIHLYF